MIRNGRLVDTKAYCDFVTSHPEKPARFPTYFDYYLAATGREAVKDEQQLDLTEVISKDDWF